MPKLAAYLALVLDLTDRSVRHIVPPSHGPRWKARTPLARHVWLALAPILLWSQAGCLGTEGPAPTSFMKRLQNQSITPEHALIQVALVEQAPGDEYINSQLWKHTDEMIVDLTRRAALEENGFRIGQLVGASPANFQQLLLSERWTKSNFMSFFAGHSETIHV